MATTFAQMGNPTHFAQNQCMDPDMDNWVDFSQIPSPTPAGSAGSSNEKQPMSQLSSPINSPTNTLLPLDTHDDHQSPMKPSHEYERFKQQTGLPTGSMASLHAMNQTGYPPMFPNYGTGLDDMDFNNLDTMTGIEPAFFFPSTEQSNMDDFIDPSAIEEPRQNVRVYPGMHQQQAAMAKAQIHAQQQRQQQVMQQQQAQMRQRTVSQQAGSSGHRRSASHQPLDARQEEIIARTVNQIRQSSSMQSDDDYSQNGGNMPSIIRSKKDEEDMDEDERLLASEEGKKLSSKERRQLRNKVSARAFRSRRKEYIGQLEGEVAVKVNEANELRAQNQALMEENKRSRQFIEKLLRHPAFHPFLEDLSREVPETKPFTPVPVQPTPQRKDANPYSLPSQPLMDIPENPQIGMALIPEPQIDMSQLTLNGNNWNMQGMNFGYQQPQVFAVLELPEGPSSPIDTEALSGKHTEEAMFEPASYEKIKADYPVIETPATEETINVKETTPASTEELDAETFALYVDVTPRAISTAIEPVENCGRISTHVLSEKPCYELVVAKPGSSDNLQTQLDRMCAKADAISNRLSALTNHFN